MTVATLKVVSISSLVIFAKYSRLLEKNASVHFNALVHLTVKFSQERIN